MRGVSGDHDLTGTVRFWGAEFFMNDGKRELLVQRDIVFKIGVDKDMSVGLDVRLTRAEELPVLGRDVIEAAGTVGFEGFRTTPDVEPMFAVGEIHLGEEELFFVVSGEERDIELLLQRDQEIDDTFAIGAAINIITHEDEVVFRLGIDDFPHVLERREAAVDIGDGECSHDLVLLDRGDVFFSALQADEGAQGFDSIVGPAEGRMLRLTERKKAG